MLPAFSDIKVKPSFLRTTAAKKPRTECCCQPVAFMMAAIVVPFGCLSRARTASCLVPPRVEAGGTVLGLTSPFARLLARENSVFLGVLTRRRHHRNPRVAASPAGQDTG
jgi:hypothetical protein